MAGAIRSLIIGGGIRAGSPATLLNFPIFTGTTPPDLLVDGNIRQDASTPPKVFIGDATLTAGATVIGGATLVAAQQDSIIIGNGASKTGAAFSATSVVIGKNAVGGASTGGVVVIGDGASAVAAGAAVNAIVIGRNATIANPAGGTSTVLVGDGATISLGSQNVVIGSTVSVNANNQNVVIGCSSQLSGGAGVASNCLVGPFINSGKTRNVLIGHGLTDINTPSGNIAIIGVGWTSTANMPSNACGFLNSAGFTTMIVGNNHEDAAPGSLTFRLCNGLGANIAAGSLTLQAGLGTGTGASAVVNLASSIPVGAGSTLQTSRTGFRMSPSTTAGQTDIMIYDVDNATLERVTVGAADSGGVGFKLLRIPN